MPKEEKKKQVVKITHKRSSGQASPEKVAKRNKHQHERRLDYFARRREALGGMNLAQYRRMLKRKHLGKNSVVKKVEVAPLPPIDDLLGLKPE